MAACQASLSFTISQSLLKLMSIESVMPSNHLILCCPPLLLTSRFPSIRVLPNESALHTGGQSIGASFRIDWFDLLAVQETLKSLIQHYNLKASVFTLSRFCGPTLTSIHDYWKNHSFDYMDLCQQSDLYSF